MSPFGVALTSATVTAFLIGAAAAALLSGPHDVRSPNVVRPAVVTTVAR